MADHEIPTPEDLGLRKVFEEDQRMLDMIRRHVEAHPEGVAPEIQKAVASGSMVRVGVLFNDSMRPDDAEPGSFDEWKALREKVRGVLQGIGGEDGESLIFLVG